ncbi:hypothetical protein [Streptomyces sp. NRRL S-87]|uniref:hypothetical protein n=1 Tax=Streptomyces sp. NRRL S-87 TaxID=1463920 RepID=UPI00131A63D0|nr:hypothetical protein [Streptomyces sp. NRRL S-87]
MTQTTVPPQPPGPPPQGRPAGRRPVAPWASEAGRSLCAGVYLDPVFRHQVIDELYVHEERVVAPSYGVDAARVLAHALRARRSELGWAVGVLLTWLLAWKLTAGLFVWDLLLPCLLLSLAAGIAKPRKGPAGTRVLAAVVRFYGRLLLVLALVGQVVSIWVRGHRERQDNGVLRTFWDVSSFVDVQERLMSEQWRFEFFRDIDGSGLQSGWGVLLFFTVLALLAGLQRGQFARMMAAELSPQKYPDPKNDPAEKAAGLRFAKVQRWIRNEQFSAVVLYGTAKPFCGAGLPFKVWNLSVELRPRTDLEDREPAPLDNERVLEHVVPLVEALRVPSPRRRPQAAATVLDRLRELVVDECVFLPVAGLRDRYEVPCEPDDFQEHRTAAIEEGGEKRRHFLRIRVGGWDEDVVVTVFVRVHTQGGMLMLEVAPHVLMPVREAYREADGIAQRYRNNSRFGKVVWAVGHAPRSLTTSVATLGRGVVSLWQVLTAGHGGARPEGPRQAVRELATDLDSSLFQDMDVVRYLKTIEDRVTGGVKVALHEAGWQTGEFEQKIVNVGSGATYVGEVHDSAVNFGEQGSATVENKNKGKPKRSSGGKQ